MRKPGEDFDTTEEDRRAQFYEHYRKEAQEHDREFMKRYDGDLYMVLIFVSSACFPDPHVFTRAAGWFFLHRHFCFHH